MPPSRYDADTEADLRRTGRVARAGMRQMSRPYPELEAGKNKRFDTPTGTATLSKFPWESSPFSGKKVDKVTTRQEDFPKSKKDPVKYDELAALLTPNAAKAALGIKVPDLTDDEKRAATSAKALCEFSESQRNGGRKHMRGALRAVAEGKLTAKEALGGSEPGFPQAAVGGLKRHRKTVDGVAEEASLLSKRERTVIDAMSDSSEDGGDKGKTGGEKKKRRTEEAQILNDVFEYRLKIEPNRGKDRLKARQEALRKKSLKAKKDVFPKTPEIKL